MATVEKTGFESLYSHCKKMMVDQDLSKGPKVIFKTDILKQDFDGIYLDLVEDRQKIKALKDKHIKVIKADKNLVGKFETVHTVIAIAKSVFKDEPKKAVFYVNLEADLIELKTKLALDDKIETPKINVKDPEIEKYKVSYSSEGIRGSWKTAALCLIDIPKSIFRYLGEIGSTIAWAAKDMMFKHALKGYQEGGMIKACIRIASSSLFAFVGVISTIFASTLYSLPKKLVLSIGGLFKAQSWVRWKISGDEKKMETRLDDQSQWVVDLWKGLEKAHEFFLRLAGIENPIEG